MDRTLVGLTGAPFAMLVEVGKIREFARAVNSTNPEYLQGWEPIAPPTYLAASGFWMSPESSPTSRVGLDFARTVNGSQEYVFHGPPPRAGSRLTGTARLEAIYTKTGRRGGEMTFVETVTDYVDDAGQLVAESRSTIIETGATVTAPPEPATATAPPPPPTPVTTATTNGEVMTPFTESPLTVTDFVRYQGVSGDESPMHHDTAFALAAGYPSPFAVGMRQAAVLADFTANHWGASNVRRFSVRFRELAWPGDVLTYRGAVKEIREVDGETLVELDLTVARQTGGLHIVGGATFVVDPTNR